MENNKQRRFTILLFSIYFIALIWIVLFKFSFHFSELDRYRNINLILYVGSAVTSEMILFAPLQVAKVMPGFKLNVIRPTEPENYDTKGEDVFVGTVAEQDAYNPMDENGNRKMEIEKLI